jgi:hypothetical protein
MAQVNVTKGDKSHAWCELHFPQSLLPLHRVYKNPKEVPWCVLGFNHHCQISHDVTFFPSKLDQVFTYAGLE